MFKSPHASKAMEKNGFLSFNKEKIGNGYIIKNKSTKQSMCPADPNFILDMVYTQSDTTETCFVWQFCDQNGNEILSESANDLKNTCFIR